MPQAIIFLVLLFLRILRESIVMQVFCMANLFILGIFNFMSWVTPLFPNESSQIIKSNRDYVSIKLILYGMEFAKLQEMNNSPLIFQTEFDSLSKNYCVNLQNANFSKTIDVVFFCNSSMICKKRESSVISEKETI